MPKKKIAAKKSTKAVSKKKVAAKKRVVKAAPKKKPVAKKGWSDFGEWWDKVAQKKVEKIERDWLKDNEPNDPDEDGGGDHWCVNEMMHSGDAAEMTAEIAEKVFSMGQNGDKWEYNQGDSLYCDLDSVIQEAYAAGRKAGK